MNKYDKLIDLMCRIMYLNIQKEFGLGEDINQKIKDEQTKLKMFLKENNINSETWDKEEWKKALENMKNKIHD